MAFLLLFAGCSVLGAGAELVVSAGELSRVASTASAGSTHAIPFFPSASDPLGRQGFARIVNRSGMSGTVTIDAFDDSGRNHGPITLTVDAGETAPFNSGDLEDGNTAKGLDQGVGRPSEGDWRLELTSDLDIMVLSYIRTSDGFVTAMHDVAPAEGNTHAIVFFNPGSNTAQVSMLRLVNAGGASASVTIHGIDDRGARAGPVKLSIPARAARTVSAAEMEEGAVGLTGSLGDGAGKWRLEVEADRPIMALSILATPTGHLTNLSTAPRLVTLPSAGDQPPAPTVEVTGAREFKFRWSWSAEAGETLAFDLAARLDGGSWTDSCREFTWDSGSRGIIVTVTTTADLAAGTVIEARYRYRNASSCDTGAGPLVSRRTGHRRRRWRWKRKPIRGRRHRHQYADRLLVSLAHWWWIVPARWWQLDAHAKRRCVRAARQLPVDLPKLGRLQGGGSRRETRNDRRDDRVRSLAVLVRFASRMWSVQEV